MMRVLIVISSPFQALCAVEAIEHYKWSYPKSIIVQTNSNSIFNLRTIDIVKNVCDDYEVTTIKSFSDLYSQCLFDLICNLRLRNRRVNTLVLGDYIDFLFSVYER